MFLAIGAEILNDGSFLKKRQFCSEYLGYELKLLKTMAPVVLTKLVYMELPDTWENVFIHFTALDSLRRYLKFQQTFLLATTKALFDKREYQRQGTP